MFSNFIYNYIGRLKQSDIEEFAKNNGVVLKKIESDIIYDQIKNHFHDVAYHTDEVLLKIKDKLEPTTYLKLKELIKDFKKKYPDYLNYL